MSSVHLHTWCASFVTCPIYPSPVDSHNAIHSLHYHSIRLNALAKQPKGALLPSFPTAGDSCPSGDQALLSLLRQRKTEEAWELYSQCPYLPNSTCLSRLVSQLSYQNTLVSLARSQSIITRLRNDDQLHLLDCNSLGLLTVSAAKSDQLPYAVSLIKFMLRSGYIPHVKAWSAVVGRLATSADDGPHQALDLFDSIICILRRLPKQSAASESLPDSTAFNNALNACANIGDKEMFLQIFEGMAEFNVLPDIISFNILIKLCARCNRIDLAVYVVEEIIRRNIPLCSSTFQSLVAAYVGFGKLETAEKLVQAMRERKRDICQILRIANYASEEEDSVDPRRFSMDNKNGVDVFQKLLPSCTDDKASEAPLLPRVFAPNSRIYTTLMKGYMKHGRIADILTMLDAMQYEDSSSQPDNVSYTTVVSTFVKLGEMDQARRFLYEMKRKGIQVNRITYNILLKGYCHQLQVGDAKILLEEMTKEDKIEPDAVSYNTLIDGCIRVDDSAGALSFFNEMRAKGIAPTKVSYTTLMKAFAYSGQPKLASKVFDEMVRDPRLKVDLIAWNTLIEGYCKLGLIDEAKKVVEKMKEMGTYPDVATYGSLANGIAAARKPGEALLLWKEVKERCSNLSEELTDGNKGASPPLNPDYELLDTLGDIFLRAAFFQKALEVVAVMEENGISPNKSKYKKIYVEMHSRMFTSKHASQARQDRRKERKRAAEAFKFWLGLPNSYYESGW